MQDEVETSESVATRSAATAVGGASPVGRVRRVRAASAQAARGGIAPRPARAAQSVRADGGIGRADGGGRSIGRRAVAFIGRGRVHRHAVPGDGQRRTVELSDDGRGHRPECVVRARVSHVKKYISIYMYYRMWSRFSWTRLTVYRVVVQTVQINY